MWFCIRNTFVPMASVTMIVPEVFAIALFFRQLGSSWVSKEPTNAKLTCNTDKTFLLAWNLTGVILVSTH